jgi:hypothetical protein
VLTLSLAAFDPRAAVGREILPLAARAQRPESLHRIRMLSLFVQGEQVVQAEINALSEELVRLGWVEGRNLRIDRSFDSDRTRTHVAELVSLAPEAIVTDSGGRQERCNNKPQNIPIVMRRYVRRLGFRA